jgi:hypothetical protein
MVAIDDEMAKCKLDLNNAKLKHYWHSKDSACSCGCKERSYIKGRAICFNELCELINEKGYSVEKNYKK